METSIINWMELLADTVQYGLVVLIGGCIGIGELISRYKDDPYEAIANRHAVAYTLVNVLASVIALLALKTMNLDGVVDGIDGEGVASHRVGYVLLAGFGAMGVLRSSAFTMRVGKDDISIGPSALLQVILSATDRAVDRSRAQVRAEMMAKTMRSIQFNQIQDSLPELAFAMMQNVKSEEREGFSNGLAQLREKKIDEVTKSICLGLSLSNIVGQGVVDAAVTALRNTLDVGGDPKAATKDASQRTLLSLPQPARVEGDAPAPQPAALPR